MNCPKCLLPNDSYAQSCSGCGAQLVAAEEKPKTVSSNKVGLIVLLIVAVMGGLIYAGGQLNGGSGLSVGSTDWIPEGFEAVPTDSDLAFKWASEGECSIVATQGCWTIKVITNKVCSRILYVEANELDANDNILGLTNATLGHIEPGQVAKLELVSLRGGVSAQLSKIQCL